jgi:hypothetical protein
MPPIRDITMLKVNPRSFMVAMAYAQLEPKEVAEKAGVSCNVVYSMRRGMLTKPKYIGKVAQALGVDLKELIE